MKDQIANAFVERLRLLLHSHQFKRLQQLNAEEQDPSVCHSHDFLDSNIIMLEAFHLHNVDAFTHEGQELWDAAWAEAKKFIQQQ